MERIRPGMNDEPIVEEIPRAGEALFDRFDHDMVAVCEYLASRTAEAADVAAGGGSCPVSAA